MKYSSYLKMKDSGVKWLGEIPEHWDVIKLKYLNKINMGQSPPSDSYNKKGIGIPFLQGNADFGEFYPETEVYCEDVNKTALENDIMISVRAPVGEINFADQQYGIGRGLCSIKPDKINRKYLWFLLRVIRNEWFLKSTGSTYDSISTEIIKSTNCLFPPKKEQKAIANFLDQETERIDKLIKKEEKLIELLEEKRQAIINKTVTKGLDPDVPMKDSGIEWLGEIPEHWELCRLKYLIKINPSKNGIEKFDKSVKVTFLPMEKIYTDGSIENDNSKKIGEINSRFTFFRNNDVLLAKITPCFENGKIAIAKNLKNGVGFGTTELHVLRAKNHIQSKFIYYMLRSNLFMKLGEAEMTGAAGQKRVPKGFIDNYFQGIPPLEEQKQIVNFLDNKTDKIKNLKTKIQKQISNLKEYRQALITNTVTGKIDVRGLA